MRVDLTRPPVSQRIIIHTRKELKEIQCKVKAPKNLKNEFAGFDYRNVEEMLLVIKPILCELGCVITFTDVVTAVGNHNYVIAKATITNSEGESVSSTAYAREDESRSGMMAPQLTGSASTYARKYALCGLLAIDSGGDPDSMDNRPTATAQPVQKPAVPPANDDRPWKEKLTEFCKEQSEAYGSEEAQIQLRAFYTYTLKQTLRGNKYGASRLFDWFVKDVHDGKIQIDDTDPKHPKVTSDKGGE